MRRNRRSAPRRPLRPVRLFPGRCQPDGTNEENQLPRAVVILAAVRISERRHPRQPHAVLNDVMNFAVGEILRFGPPQIRRLGIKILADPRASVAILAVAARAVVGEILTRFLQEVGSRGPRIFFIPRGSRNSQVPHGPRHGRLNGGRLIRGAESSPDHTPSRKRQQGSYHNQDEKKYLPPIHLFSGSNFADPCAEQVTKPN